MPFTRLMLAGLLATAATLLVAGTALSATSEPEQQGELAFVDVVVAEQAMDHQGRPAGPKRLVEFRRERHSGDATGRAERPRAPAATRRTTRSLQGVGCKTVWASRIGKSWIGAVLWKFTQEKYFCWSTPRITAVRVNSYPCCTDPTWHWKGHIGKRAWYLSWSGSSRGGHYSFRQGKFRQDLVKFKLSTKQPWVKIWVWGNGDWSYRTGS